MSVLFFIGCIFVGVIAWSFGYCDGSKTQKEATSKEVAELKAMLNKIDLLK